MNIVSTRSIEVAASAVAGLAMRPEVKDWMRRAAERHIRKSPEMLVKVVSRHQIEHELGRNSQSKKLRLTKEASRELAEKLSAQLAAGSDLYIFDPVRNEPYRQFLAESRNVIDWLDAIPEWDRHLRRIARMSYAEAAALSADWHRRLLELPADGAEGLAEEIEIAAAYEDGCRFVELKGPIALLREGNLMGHCVGGRNYVEALQKGATRIFSFRDPSNRPHVTIEVRRSWRRKGLSAIQIKGRGNAAPALDGGWAAYCRAFIISQGWEVTRDGNLIGLFTIAGRTYDDPDDMLNALLDQVQMSELPTLRFGALSRLLGDTAMAGVIQRNVSRLKASTRQRLLRLLAPTSEPAFGLEGVLVQGPERRSIEVRRLAMPSALMEGLASGFFSGLEDEVAKVVAPYLGKTVSEMRTQAHHVHKLEVGGLPKGADLLQQVVAFCGLTKQFEEVRSIASARRVQVAGELSSAIRRAARSGLTPPPEVGDWARQLAHLEQVSRAAIAKMAVDSRHLVI